MKYLKEDIRDDQVFKNFLDRKNINNKNTIIQYETRIKSTFTRPYFPNTL
jgi:hypothetical protein